MRMMMHSSLPVTPTVTPNPDPRLEAIHQYMQEISGFPRLSVEEEQRLKWRLLRGRAERSKPCPDPQIIEEGERARTALIEGYLKFVVSLAKPFFPYCHTLTLLDLIQEGNLGLMRAIEKWDDTHSCRLSTLAYPWILGIIKNAINERDGAVHRSSRAHKDLSRLRRARTNLVNTLNREPTVAELAQTTRFCVQKVQQVLSYEQHNETLSLQQLVEEDQDDGCLEYRLSLTPLCSWAEVASRFRSPQNPRREMLLALVRQAIPTLPPGQRQVLQWHYGWGEDERAYSIEEIAHMRGISASGVYRNQAQAVARPRRMFLRNLAAQV